MNVQLTPEQEERLARIATVEGVSPGQLLVSTAERIFEADDQFRESIWRGLEQADRGEFIEESEMDARVARLIGR